MRAPLLFSLLALAACNQEGMARAASQPQSSPKVVVAAGNVVPGDSVSARPAGAAAQVVDTGAKRAPAGATGTTDARRDSTSAHALHLRMAAGRSKQDSSSFYGAVRSGMRNPRWPVPGPAPLSGAELPARRIVAFYGNPLSKKMGVLGEYPVDEMLAKLDQEVAAWRAADPSTPVQPALHLIAVVAQGGPGRDGLYRLRMDSSLIEKVYGWAQSRHALLFLDIQAGKSTIQSELPRLLPFLSRPDVELGLDPEFYMHYDREGLKPGAKIGTMDAKDVNYAIRTLDALVAQKHLPPKVLVVHRFTRRMVTNADAIKPTPNVQVVMNMDGWGPPWLKFDSYRDYVEATPVQYTGFKIFFHNDTKKGNPLLTPFEVLQLVPKPNYIQYQ